MKVSLLGKTFPNSGSDPVVTGTQQDTDLLIAFKEKEGESYHLVLAEAKGYSPWSNKQMEEKGQRLKGIFERFGKEHHPEVTPHFCLMSSREPAKLETESWPTWMWKDVDDPYYWLELKLAPSRLEVTRCDSTGKSSKGGDHFCINEVQKPSE